MQLSRAEFRAVTAFDSWGPSRLAERSDERAGPWVRRLARDVPIRHCRAISARWVADPAKRPEPRPGHWD